MNENYMKILLFSNDMKYLRRLIPFIFLCFLQYSCENSQSIDFHGQINDTIYFKYDLFQSNLKCTTLYSEINYVDNLIDTSNNYIYKMVLIDSNMFVKDTAMSFYNIEYEFDSLMMLVNSGFFHFNDNLYYYLFYSNFYYSCGQCPYLVSMYEYSFETRKLKNIPIGYQASGDASCFGDFNNDQKLDFIHWDFTDTVRFYSFDKYKKKFVLDENYFIKLTEKSYNKFIILKNKSKWFRVLI